MKIKILITMVGGSQVGQTTLYQSELDHCVVGRAGSNLMISDRSCSRQHALLFEGFDARLYIRDLKSQNGTMVNGTRVHEINLEVGDQIRVGDTQLTVVDYLPSVSTKPEQSPPAAPKREPSRPSNPDVITSWPDNLRALPKSKQAEFVDYIDDHGAQTRANLKDILKKKNAA